MKSQTLSVKALNRALLGRQILLAREGISVPRAISQLVGLQAQHPQPPFVGLWTRLIGFERGHLLRLLESRAIVRSTLMRATLHLMTAEDFILLRRTLQPVLTGAMQSVLRTRAAALDLPALISAAHDFLAEEPRTFAQLRQALVSRFPSIDERAIGYAVRTHLPLVAVPATAEWGYRPDPEFIEAGAWLEGSIDTDDRPTDLVLRYLAAFGPATPGDFQTWSGYAGAKPLFDLLRPQLQTYRDERKRELFDLPDAPCPSEDTAAPVRFLPGFDNIILAHADRTRIIADEYRARVTTRNLQVLPTFLVDGFVAGTWKYSVEKKSAILSISPFAPLTKSRKAALSDEAEPLVRFLGPNATKWSVRFESP